MCRHSGRAPRGPLGSPQAVRVQPIDSFSVLSRGGGHVHVHAQPVRTGLTHKRCVTP